MHGVLITADATQTIASLLDHLRELSHDTRIDAVAVIDADGRLVGDLSILDLHGAARASTAGELVQEGALIAVPAGSGLADTFDLYTSSRRSSIVVVDADRRPIGRITGVDLIIALDHARHPWLPRLRSRIRHRHP